VRFRHPLIRSAIADNLMSPVARALAHATAARILYDEAAPSQVIASHVVLTDFVEDSWLLETLLDAARIARDQGARDVATDFLKRALRESLSTEDRIRVLTALGNSELPNNPPAAIRYMRECAELVTDPVDRAKAVGYLAVALFLSHRGSEAIAVLEEAVTELRNTPGHESGPLGGALQTLEAQLTQVTYYDSRTSKCVTEQSCIECAFACHHPGSKAVAPPAPSPRSLWRDHRIRTWNRRRDSDRNAHDPLCQWKAATGGQWSPL
jgi:hypothetical protein